MALRSFVLAEWSFANIWQTCASGDPTRFLAREPAIDAVWFPITGMWVSTSLS
jgi:hypothetical protein